MCLLSLGGLRRRALWWSSHVCPGGMRVPVCTRTGLACFDSSPFQLRRIHSVCVWRSFRQSARAMCWLPAHVLGNSDYVRTFGSMLAYSKMLRFLHTGVA